MLKRIDAFSKPRHDLREQSALGGLITLVASFAAGCLFLGQMYTYITGVTRHSLSLSQSQWVPVRHLDDPSGYGEAGHIPFKVHVSFPHMPCSRLDMKHDGVSYKDDSFRNIHGPSTKVVTRILTAAEWKKSTGIASKEPTQRELSQGCTYTARYEIPKVGGTFWVGMSSSVWREVAPFLMLGFGFGSSSSRGPPGQKNNVTHYIHSMTFGEIFPLSENPLKDDMHLVLNDNDNSGGIALANVKVKLVPTRYQGFLTTSHMYQLSVTEHIVRAQTMTQQGSTFLPGLAVNYDFVPLTVHHAETRDNPLVFFSSLVSIVGGVFVTVSLVTGCLVHSAAEIAKKID